MKKTVYPPEFERLWSTFDPMYGEKGSKKNAYKVFKDMEINAEDVDLITFRVEQQKAAKDLQRRNGEFCSSFQHVERYLKNERWDDEIVAGNVRPDRETRGEYHDRKAREYLESLGRGDGKDMAGSYGYETGERTHWLN